MGCKKEARDKSTFQSNAVVLVGEYSSANLTNHPIAQTANPNQEQRRSIIT